MTRHVLHPDTPLEDVRERLAGARVLTFSIPPGLWLTANRHHANRAYRARIVRDLHDLAVAVARQARNEAIYGPVAADWTVRYPKGVRKDKGDASNAQPTCKALLDGLVQVGLLEDDGPQHVSSETYRRGPNLIVPSLHEIRLVLTPGAIA